MKTQEYIQENIQAKKSTMTHDKKEEHILKAIKHINLACIEILSVLEDGPVVHQLKDNYFKLSETESMLWGWLRQK